MAPNAGIEELFVPHLGWFIHEPGDEVARYLNQGWFEYREQAFMWLYPRRADVFLDCGAHFGLYSALYDTAAEGASVWAVEPNPSTRRFLGRNLRLRARRRGPVTVIPAAISSLPGNRELHLGGQTRSAYATLQPDGSSAKSVPVCCTTIDQICDQICKDHQLENASMMKLDVEGEEIGALEGAAKTLAGRQIAVMMVEFSELNLARSGRSTKDLYEKIEAAGYRMCRFDEDRLELVPVPFAGPVYYENYFAAASMDAVNQRLRTAPRSRKRIAQSVIRRGKMCHQLYSAASDRTLTGEAMDRLARLLDQSFARIGEANWRADEANARAAQALKQLEESWARIGEANARADQAWAKVRGAK